ncbi:MAG: thioredoxin domain-containing protein [Candidatus Omnitrophica bacterium]|nr:thioredoxin domain-containing protein [Candidatus Omnitrophota bacterium]
MRPARGAVASLLLSLIGAALSGYLYFLHVGLLRGEFLGGAACGGSGVFNCHAVTGGPLGSFLGMPLALWGILGYLSVFALSLLAQQSAEWALHAVTLTALLALVFVGIDVALLGLMAFVIRFYCLFCLLTYAVNLALLFVAVRSLGRPWPDALRQAGAAAAALIPSRARPAAGLFWGMMLLAVSGAVGLEAATTFLSQGPGGAMQTQIREFLSKQLRASVEIAGDPTIGSPTAGLQIIEFSDFFCPACQRASKLNTILIANHRRDAAFTFKHFPLDTACNSAIGHMVHPGACAAAAASECAHQQGTFWPFHDLVFEKGRLYNVALVEEDARRLGLDVSRFQACLKSGEGMEAVKRDIAEGNKWKIASTPTYVINGVVVPGGFNPSTFEAVVTILREKR